MLRSVVVLIFIFIFALLAIKKRYVALLMYWWFAIFRPQDWVWWDISDYRLPLVATIILVVPALIQGYWPRLKHPLAIMMVFWLALAILAKYMNGCVSVGSMSESMKNMLVLIPVVLLTERLITNKLQFFGVITIIALSIGFHSGKSGIYALVSGATVNYGINNLTGLFSGSNAYALGSGMLLFFIVFVCQQLWQKHNLDLIPEKVQFPMVQMGITWFCIFASFGTFYNVVSLFSRGAALAMFIGIGLWMILHDKKTKILSFAIPLTLIALLFIPVPQGYIERIETAFAKEEQLDKSSSSRFHFWKIADQIAHDYPIGIGPGCYKHYYNLYDVSDGQYGQYRSVHSAHFQILAETGYLGIGIWMLLFTVSYKTLWSLRRKLYPTIHKSKDDYFYFYACNTLICAQTVYLIGSSFYEIAHSDLIWLLWGLVITVQRLIHDHKGSQSKKFSKTARLNDVN